MTDKIVADKLKVSKKETGNFIIKDERVMLTKKGLIESQRPKNE